MNERLDIVIQKLKEKTKKYCYSITVLDEEPSLFDSKIGGVPYIAINEDYPKDSNGDYMPLFIQINFKDIELENYPKNGLLQLFVDKELSYPTQYKVRYIENIDNNYNKNLPKIDCQFIAQAPIKIKLQKNETYMPVNDFRFNTVFCKIFNEVFNSNIAHYFDVDEVTGDKNSEELIFNKLEIEKGLVGGYADFTQNDPRNNGNENLTECLIKIDSYLDKRIMIGDMGIAWLLISEEDLKAKKFENAQFDWDCH